jgi:hypothetical protein
MEDFDKLLKKICLYIMCFIIVILGIEIIAAHLRIIGVIHYYQLSYILVSGVVGVFYCFVAVTRAVRYVLTMRRN